MNQSLFQQKVVNISADTHRCTNDEQVEIPADELNVMQYACGYVPYKLIKKYEGRKGDRHANILECLGNMAVTSDVHDPDLLSYTRLWFETVNRGGLFPLNDETFLK